MENLEQGMVGCLKKEYEMIEMSVKEMTSRRLELKRYVKINRCPILHPLITALTAVILDFTVMKLPACGKCG